MCLCRFTFLTVCSAGTTERACLITGSVEGIMVVLDFIMDKIKEKPELVKPFPEGVDTKMPQDRDKQVNKNSILAR